MADDGWTYLNDAKDFGGQAPSDETPTWGDYGKAVKSGAKELGSSLAAGTRAMSDGNKTPGGAALNALSKYLQKSLGESAEHDVEEMTPAARERVTAAVTDPAFLRHPTSAFLLQTAKMTPAIAGTVIPGILTGGTSGVVMTAIAGGTMNAASAVKELSDAVDKKTDEELIKDAPYYAALRSAGMSEEDARDDFNGKVRGLTPWLNAVVGAAASVIGPAGSAVRALSGRAAVIGTAGKGVLARAGAGVAEGGGAMAAQGGVADVSVQAALMGEGLQKEYDWNKTLNSMTSGLVLGGVPGGFLGAVSRGHGAKTPEVKETVIPPKGAGTGTQPKPPDSVRPADTYSKEAKGEGGSEININADPAGPNPEQVVALTPYKPTPRAPEPPAPEMRPAPPPEMAQRPPEPPRPAPEVTPEVTNAPPPVVEAPPRPAEEVQPVPARQVAEPPKELTPEPVALATPEPEAPVRAPRVLKDLAQKDEKPVLAAEKKNNKKLADNSKEVLEGPVKKKVGSKHYTDDETTKRELDATKAKDAIETHIPFEELPFPTKAADRAALREHVESIVNDLTQGGVEIPSKAAYKGTDPYILLASEAQSLARKFQKGRTPSMDDMKSFVVNHNLIRKGAADVVKESRKAEAPGIGTGALPASPELPERAVTDASVSGSARGRVRGVEDYTEKREIKLKSGEVVNEEGTKAAATRSVSPEIAAEIAARYGAVVKPKVTPEVTASAMRQEHGVQEPPKSVVTYTRDADGNPLKLTHHPVHSTDFATALKTLSFDHLKGPARMMAMAVANRLKNAIGDTPVHVLPASELPRSWGYHQPAVDGKPAYIALNAKRMSDPAGLAHTLLHEGIHNALTRAIENHTKVREGFLELATYVRKAIDVDKYRDANGDLPQWLYAFAHESEFDRIHEFASEAHSNQELQKALTEIRLPAHMSARLGLGTRATAWDWLSSMIRRVLGIKGDHTAFDAVLRLSDDAFTARRDLMKVEQTGEALYSQQLRAPTRDEVTSKVNDLRINATSTLRDWRTKLASKWMLAQRSRAYGKDFGDSAHTLVDTEARMHAARSKILETSGGQEIVRRSAELEREFGSDVAREAASVAFDASNMNVNLGPGADNSHLGVNKRTGWQAKARLPELQRRFDALPKEWQDQLTASADFFKRTQNEIALQDVRNILKAVDGGEEPGLAERIFNDGLTDADKARFKTNTVINAINDARAFRQMEGWYTPFRRYGDFVVSGHHELEAPKGAIKVGDDTVQFANASDKAGERMAKAFVEKHELTHTDTKKVWVDKNDHTKVLEKEDVDAIPAYRVTMQTQHTEFHPDEAAARHAETELKGDGLNNVFMARREDEANRASGMMSAEMRQVMYSLEQQKRFQAMSKLQQESVKQALLEASVRLQGSTRLSSSLIARRNVAGMSDNLPRVTADYAKTSAAYLAKLRFQPKIDDAVNTMDEVIKAYRNDKFNLKRTEVRNAFVSRLHEDPQKPPSAVSNATTRLLQISRQSRLASPGFHIINAQEPWTTSLPMIAGRHGPIAAIKGLVEGYNMIGGRKGVIGGIKDTIKAATSNDGFVDYIKQFKDEIDNYKGMSAEKAQRQKDVIDYLNERGLYNNDAIFEVGRHSDPTSNIAGRAIDRADLMANQLGTAIEAINRSVTALAEYNLEYKKNGGNHEGAMARAFEITHDTMGDYSAWNNSPLFKTTAGKFMLQFKKFGVKMYYLLGKTFNGMIHGDAEAAKQFGGLMVTHMMVAGALGLPLEPFKVAFMAAGWFGLTNNTWGDVESYVRVRAADVLGAKGGEAFSHGLTRLIGVETSSRQGLDNLAAGLGSRSNKISDIKSYLFDTVAGAPPGVIIDWIRAGQAAMKGDLGQALQYAVPIKTGHDLAKAYQGQNPKQSASGRDTMRALTPYETAVQALGFTPSAVAENYAKRNAFYGDSKDRRDERTKLYGQWANAKGDERSKLWGKIEAYNKTLPRDAQITRADLDRNAKTRADEARKGTVVGGIRAGKRDKDLLKTYDIYNTQ